MDKVLELKKCVKSVKIEAEKFFLRNNTSAGVRVRKKLQDCKKISQNIRKLVQNVKFKFIQKKAKIKAARAAYLGENILSSQKFRLKCLKDNNSANIKFKNPENSYIEDKTISNRYISRITDIYNLENLIQQKTQNQIPKYSIFDYDN